MQEEPQREPQEAQAEPQAVQPAPPMEPVESRGERLRRHGRRVRLYTSAFAVVAVVVILVALVLDNTAKVKLSWVFGSGRASLVWVILVSAVLGWLLGIFTSVLFHVRTRRRRSSVGASDASRG